MSFAWRQLQPAIRILAGPGDPRERLNGALNKLIRLKTRDLPSEVSRDFEALTGGISRFPAKNIVHEIRAEVARLSDTEVAEAIQAIMRLYDAAATYQPRPVKHSGGMRNRTEAAKCWPISAVQILENRQGKFFRETA